MVMVLKLCENTDIYTIMYTYNVAQLNITKWLKDVFDGDVKCKTSILYTL